MDENIQIIMRRRKEGSKIISDIIDILEENRLSYEESLGILDLAKMELVENLYTSEDED